MTLLVSPPQRWNAVMAELPTSSELVLFGGKTTANIFNGITAYKNGILNDTWSWNGTAWTNISTGISGNTLTNPTPRYSSSMSFDGTYVTMVGGTNGIRNLSETWSYNTGSGWFQQPLTNSISLNPPPLYSIPSLLRDASMAYQSGVSGGEAVLFGGNSSSQRHYVMDTWVWVKGNPGTWTYLSPVNSPTGRTNAAIASSATTAVLFGGKNFDGWLSDTWTWNGTNWTQITGLVPGTTCPSARYGAMMAYDANHSKWVLFGGVTVNGYSNETWTFNGTTWTNVTPATSPSPRAYGAMAYLTANTTTVLFGGLDSLVDYNDTWVWNGTTWTQQ